MTQPITDIIRQISGGEFLDKASDLMQELNLAIDERGGSGSVTLKISVKKTTSGAMTVTGKATLSKPAEAPMESILFITPEGNLVPNNPRQQDLKLKVVEQDVKPLKQANA